MSQLQEGHNSVVVDDIYVIGYLLANNYEPGEKSINSGRVSVRFTGSGVSDQIADFFSNSSVPVQDYVRGYQRAKELVYVDKGRKKFQRNRFNERRKQW